MSRGWPRRVAPFLLLWVGLIVAYLGALSSPLFQIDDQDLIKVPQIIAPFGWQSLVAIFTPGNQVDYYPIRDLSYLFDAHLFGPNWAAFRTHQLLLFWLCGVGLYWVLRELGASRARSLFAAAVWALAPIHAEMVIWLSARKDVMALLFVLLSSGCFLRGLRLPGRRWMAGAVVLFVLSLGSKSTFSILPVAVLVGALLGLDARLKSRPALGVLILCAGMGLMWGAYQNWFYSHVNDMRLAYRLSYRLQASAAALAKMLGAVIVPRWNIVDVENWGEWLDLNRQLIGPGIVIWCLSLVGSVWVADSWLRERKQAWAVWVAILGWAVYLPISGLVFPHRNFFSIRYAEPLYLLGVFALALRLRWSGTAAQRFKKWLWVVPLLLLVLCSREAAHWDSSASVFEKALKDSPQSTSLKIKLWWELYSDRDKQEQASALGHEIREICLGGSVQIRRSCGGYWLAHYLHLTPSTADFKLFEERLKQFVSSEMPDQLGELAVVLAMKNDRLDPLVASNYLNQVRYENHYRHRFRHWAAECVAKGPESARARLAGYRERRLLDDVAFDFMWTQSVSGALESQLRTCL